MNTEHNKLSAYISWILNMYAEFRRDCRDQTEAPFTVVDYKKNKQGKFEAEVHLRRKRLIFKKLPEIILADDTLTESFSKKDIRLLTYLACENKKEPKRQMIGQSLKSSTNKIVFKLKHDKTGEEIEKDTSEIFRSPELIKTLDSEDAYTIGYVTANEQIKKEAILIHYKPEEKASTLKLIAQVIKSGTNKIYLKLKNNETGQEIEKSVKEVFENPELIKSINSEDAYAIGYTTANEQIKNEKIQN
ncbi:MAG: hypothetical protein V4496_02140 [Pseudomonadota bacterium]